MKRAGASGRAGRGPGRGGGRGQGPVPGGKTRAPDGERTVADAPSPGTGAEPDRSRADAPGRGPSRAAHWHARRRPTPPRLETTDEMTVLYGHHAVAAALDNPARRLRSLLVSEAGGMHIEASIRRRGIAPTVVAPGELDRMLGGESVHQGVVMTADPLDGPDVGELAARLARARQRTDPRDGERGGAPRPLVVLLDQVTDPHNVGAILRSAAVFGLIGLVMTRHNSPPLGGALAKAASGGLELVPVALVANLARALDTLADGGVTVLGLDAQGNGRIEDVATGSDPIALVLGAEDKGLRRLTRERCDAIVSISTAASMTSLNVSNAAAIAFHALSRR